MNENQIKMYNDHALFLADIAEAILLNNKSVLNISGVKEIIALYLMIPYMTSNKLDTPNEKCIIPSIQGDFCESISYENLRNTIAHSFVTVEEEKDDGGNHGKVLIFDDRIITDKREHTQKGFHSEAYHINIDYIRKELLEKIQEIKNN